MKKVCCACGKDLGEVPGPPGRVTHGFCEACYLSELRSRQIQPGAPVGHAREEAGGDAPQALPAGRAGATP